jgi:hypothetical protein
MKHGLSLVLILLVALALVLLILAACQATPAGRPTLTPCPAPICTPTPTLTPRPSPTPTPTLCPVPICTPTSTSTPRIPTDTPRPTGTSQPTNTPRPTITITSQPSPTPRPPLRVEAEWPPRMTKGRANSVTISLVRILFSPSPEPSRIVVTATLIPIPYGTPGLPPEQAFGSEYEVCAEADLAAAGFDKDSLTPQPNCQSLDQERISWTWNITPKNEGEQRIPVSIMLQWTPKSGGQSIYRKVWERTLIISVEDDTIVLGMLCPTSMVPIIVAVAIAAIISLGGGLKTLVGDWFTRPIKWLQKQWQKGRPPTRPPFPPQKS